MNRCNELVAVEKVTVLGMMLALGACTNNPTNTCTPATTGGPVSGATDSHCAGMSHETSQSACMFVPDMAGPPPDMTGVAPEPEFGDTMYNAEGDDDDCKYHVKFTSTAICNGASVTFSVTATTLSDKKPAVGAAVVAEVFLPDAMGNAHPAPNSGVKTTDLGGGNYAIGPVVFDASGKWTVRFHLFENCLDYADESPHGHAAFYLNVP